VVDAAMEWANKTKKGIIWYEHKAFHKKFIDLGLPVYGPGQDASTATEPVIVCSIRAQGTGKNLQYMYNHNLVLSMPPNGGTVEQLIGRTHRSGQTEDKVYIDWFAHTSEMTKAFTQALEDAKGTEEREGQPQRLLQAEIL